jgi:hypothetical protein
VASSASKGLRVVAAALAVLVVLAGSWYAYAKVSKPGCGSPVRLSVAAAPELAPALQAQAGEWASGARVSGNCVAVDVIAVESADIAAAVAAQGNVQLTGVGLASGKTKIPDVWVADSSLWLLRLRTAKQDSVPATGQSVAKSPIVLAVPEPIATTLGWPQAKLTWGDLLKKVTADSKLKVGIVDPVRDSSGLSGLLAMSVAAQATGAQATQNATAALRALAAGSSSVRDEVLRRFPHATDPASLASGLSVAPLSEQAVVTYNATQPPVRLASLYVEPAPAPLDYPYVAMPGLSADKAAAASSFAKALAADSFRDRLAGLGLRSADGSTGKGFQMPAGAPASLNSPAGATLDGATLDKLLQTWLTVALPARMLAVLDVSGSMLITVPTAGNRTRMEVTTEAARKGLGLFDDRWSVGLWVFSTLLDGNKDHKELAPIAPLSAQRTQLLQSLAQIKPKKDGDTGLYDTILAGYKAVQQGWDEGAINSLVVMTDGQNEDDNGLSIDQLLAELQKTVDPKKPISVILIGIGTTIGQAEMEKITNAVGGGTFIAPDPAKIGEIFLKAISLRSTQQR